MLIYGSVGYTLLEKDNKKVLIFADIHDGVSYCNNPSTSISELFKNRKNKILLEEAIQEEVKLKDLWPNSKHTQELKKLYYQNSDKIIPVDIRPLLVPFSWELIDTSKHLGEEFKFDMYLKNIYFFLTKRGKLYKKYVSTKLDLIKDYNTNRTLNIHFSEIKNFFHGFIKKKKGPFYKQKMIYIKNHHIDLLYDVNNIMSMIMEWYVILLIFTNDTESVVHVGLAHSNKINELLEKVYGFKKLDQKGINILEQIYNVETPSACILLPKDVHDMFNKKVSFY